MTNIDLIEGAIYGMALGDAWGYHAEFKTHEYLLANPPVIPNPLVITDDTQMSIANIRALQTITKTVRTKALANTLVTNVRLQNDIRRIFAEEHLLWSEDPRNNRAPGLTCMGALKTYAESSRKTGEEGRKNNSKGCGTVMRAPWLGLLPFNRQTIAALALLQSQTTHGHPAAGLASIVVALVTHSVYHRGTQNINYWDEAIAAVDWVKQAPGTFFMEVLNEAHQMRRKLQMFKDTFHEVQVSSEATDINNFYGEGWVGDEALFNALGASELYKTSPQLGLRRLITTRGDSDSIAAIGGALIGVYNGYKNLNHDVKGTLEASYKPELYAIIEYLKS